MSDSEDDLALWFLLETVRPLIKKENVGKRIP